MHPEKVLDSVARLMHHHMHRVMAVEVRDHRRASLAWACDRTPLCALDRLRFLVGSTRPEIGGATSYTLADLGEGMQITAIAHNETPRLRAAIERQRLT